MRLKALTIKNFKGIDEAGIRIELAPITLLFGPNNIGKSTVLQSLLLAREAFHGAIPDKIEARQHGVELGSFKDYVHKHDVNRAISICFTFAPAPEDWNRGKHYDAVKDLLQKTVQCVGVEICIRWNKDLNLAEVSDYILYVNNRKFAAVRQNSYDKERGYVQAKNAERFQAGSSLYVYDITPFMLKTDSERLENMWHELRKRIPDADQKEEARVFFKSAPWKQFLKLYFEAIPSIMVPVANVNYFLGQLGMPKGFLNKDWLDEIYEKSFYYQEKIDLELDRDEMCQYILECDPNGLKDILSKIKEGKVRPQYKWGKVLDKYEWYCRTFHTTNNGPIEIYQHILADFPNDEEFISKVINGNDNAQTIFKRLLNYFSKDFTSVKRLCNYYPGTYPYFLKYYNRMDHINDNDFWKKHSSLSSSDQISVPENDSPDVRKEYCYKILIKHIKNNDSMFDDDIFYPREDGYMPKVFYSLDDYLLYKKFLGPKGDYFNEIQGNHWDVPDGSLSVKRNSSSRVKYNYTSLSNELIHYFPLQMLIFDSYLELMTKECLSIITSPFEAIGAYLDSLLYIGPLRKIPERGSKGLWFNGLDALTFNSNWRDGMGAWEWMATASEQELAELNSKLHGKGSMETGFTVKRRQFIRLEKGGELFNAMIHAQKTGLEETQDSPLRKLLELPPSEVQLSIVDLQTGLETEPYSMGTGVSQVLPIVAASVAANGKLALLEQPELHIHPKLQTTLGDIFLAAAGKAMFVLETHSEHLMLRLLRRIRETTEGELPDGAPSATVDDVAVNYIQKNDNDNIEATAIPVTPDGDFAHKWPNGFFAERAEELF